MEIIVFKTDTDIIRIISPTSDKQVKVVDKDIPAVVEPQRLQPEETINGVLIPARLIPAKVVKPAIYEFHMVTVKGIDLAMQAIPTGAEHKIVDSSEIPKDYSEFKGFEGLQSALNYDLTLDIPRAKEIKKAKLRYEREPLFIANDLKIRDANIDKDTTALMEAITERDRLRDITLLVDPCKTISAIKKITV